MSAEGILVSLEGCTGSHFRPTFLKILIPDGILIPIEGNFWKMTRIEISPCGLPLYLVSASEILKLDFRNQTISVDLFSGEDIFELIYIFL